MSKLTDLDKMWSREPDYREAYDRLGPKFELSIGPAPVLCSRGLSLQSAWGRHSR